MLLVVYVFASCGVFICVALRIDVFFLCPPGLSGDLLFAVGGLRDCAKKKHEILQNCMEYFSLYSEVGLT